jgi:hypothetical protein
VKVPSQYPTLLQAHGFKQAVAIAESPVCYRQRRIIFREKDAIDQDLSHGRKVNKKAIRAFGWLGKMMARIRLVLQDLP